MHAASVFPDRRRCFVMAMLASQLLLAPIASCAADGPSFDCARVTSAVNKMICASPELAMRDRDLADHFRAQLGQPGTDGPALQRDEARWLRDVRDTCADPACIAHAYDARDADLLARSRHAAGPAADDETRPFAVDAALWLDARALRGKACASDEDVPRGVGFVSVPGAVPVVSNGSVVLVRRHLGADFAVLLDTRRDACRVVDVVALPPHAQLSPLLQCTVPSDDGTATPLSTGVGLRRPGRKAPIAYWEVDIAHGQFIRQPLGVLGWEQKLRCQEPETGD